MLTLIVQICDYCYEELTEDLKYFEAQPDTTMSKNKANAIG